MANETTTTTAAASAGSVQGASPKSARRTQTVAFGIGLAVILCAMPFVLTDFTLFQLTQAMVYAIALFGLNLLTGYNGQISLGHGAFYGIGAYVAAILIDRVGVPYWATIPIAGIFCYGIGFLFGLPALRLEGLYLALATLALALAVPQLLRFDPLEPLTGGVQGITLDKPRPPLGLPLSEDQWLYLLTLVILVIMFWAGWNVVRGRIGRAMVAIRDHHISAETMGINTAIIKTTTFGASALYTGIAGALSANVIAFVAPDSFELFLSIALIVGLVIGGLASVSGPIYGGLFMVFVPNFAEQVSKAAPWAIYGIILILAMFFMPHGVAGFVRWARYKLKAIGGKTP